MGDWIVPLLLLLLVALAVGARGVFQPRIAAPLAGIAALAVATYTVLEGLLPRATSALLNLIEARSDFKTVVGTLTNSTPSAAQTWPGRVREPQSGARTDQGDAAAAPLRLRRIEGSQNLLVLRGDRVLGELSTAALAEFDEAADPNDEEASRAESGAQNASFPKRFREPAQLPDVAAAPPPGTPPEPLFPITLPSGAEAERAIASDPRQTSIASATAEASSSPDPEYEPPRRPVLAKPIEDAEVELRTRANLLAVERACLAADLLQSGRDPRTQALARELEQRCQRASR